MAVSDINKQEAAPPQKLRVISDNLLVALWNGLCAVEPCPYSYMRMRELDAAVQESRVFRDIDDLRTSLLIGDTEGAGPVEQAQEV